MWLIMVPNICPYKSTFVVPNLEHREKRQSKCHKNISLPFPFYLFQMYTTKEMLNHIFPSTSCCSLIGTMELCFLSSTSLGNANLSESIFLELLPLKNASFVQMSVVRIQSPNLTQYKYSKTKTLLISRLSLCYT